MIAAVQGELDFDLLGILLACPFRVCAEDTVFVNRVLEVGVSPGSAWSGSSRGSWAQAGRRRSSWEASP